MSFLTNENGQFILDLLHRFLMDTYQFKLQSVMNEQSIRKLLETTMVSIYKKNDKHTSVEQLNKMTIVELKEYIKKTYIQKPEDPPPIPLSEDSDFTNKVQQLEFQRKTFQVPVAPVPPVISTPSPINTIPPTLSTVYMPMPPKIGKEILIHSMVRDWHRYFEHFHFEWNGPIHHTSDSLTRVVGVIGNLKETAIQVYIQGAGGEVEKVTLILNSNMYQPALPSLGYIKRLSLPWKISLLSLYGTPLQLGKGLRYTCEKKNKETVLHFTEPHSFKEGDCVLVCMDNKSFKRSLVISIEPFKIVLYEDILMEGYVLNEKEHYSILLEMTTSEHRPITKS